MRSMKRIALTVALVATGFLDGLLAQGVECDRYSDVIAGPSTDVEAASGCFAFIVDYVVCDDGTLYLLDAEFFEYDAGCFTDARTYIAE